MSEPNRAPDVGADGLDPSGAAARGPAAPEGLRRPPLLVLAGGDDVGAALRDLGAGERVAYTAGAEQRTVQILEPIPFGHKVALRDLPAGEPVHKYGAVIGRTTAMVRAGAHVHVHNLSGIRGRGDLAAGARAQGDGKGTTAHAAQG